MSTPEGSVGSLLAVVVEVVPCLSHPHVLGCGRIGKLEVHWTHWKHLLLGRKPWMWSQTRHDASFQLYSESRGHLSELQALQACGVDPLPVAREMRSGIGADQSSAFLCVYPKREHAQIHVPQNVQCLQH
jgi:hypothetical protein